MIRAKTKGVTIFSNVRSINPCDSLWCARATIAEYPTTTASEVSGLQQCRLSAAMQEISLFRELRLRATVYTLLSDIATLR